MLYYQYISFYISVANDAEPQKSRAPDVSAHIFWKIVEINIETYIPHKGMNNFDLVINNNNNMHAK